ncbi:MAG: hypothetical protein Q7T16_01065 [Candidatus Burarchaeum sp.]|nr:hypothetical protein [Candidatus Burarchaeum sp.]MDO8339226.1 hypothetical protein [Candidatus Burarchaeum sp.]
MMKSKDMICDSSSLISLADSCLLPALKAVKDRLNGKIFISPRVEYESITHPREIKEYSLAALRLKQALVDGTLTLIQSPSAKVKTQEILRHANNVYSVDRRSMHIIQDGEAEMLALAAELGVQNILMDERTTRMLSEAPWELHAHYEREFGKPVKVNGAELEWFAKFTKGMSIFRSSEIVVAAYELGYFKNYRGMEREMLEASLYALKFAGCGISFEEIQEFMGRKK